MSMNPDSTGPDQPLGSGSSADASEETDAVEHSESSPSAQRLAEREDKDDGTVPDKQIQRWKGEGGAWIRDH